MSIIRKTITEEYIPFGYEWEKAMMNFTKKQLIELLTQEYKKQPIPKQL